MHRLFGPDDPLWWSVGPASLEPRETLERQLVLEGDRCMTLWAVALPADATIELEVLDAGGRRIARDAVRDSFPLLPDLCLQGPANYRVVARATRQAAEVLLQAAHIVDPLRIGASLALLAARDAATPDAVPWGPVERVHLVEGQRVSVPVAMPAGRCYSVHAVAGGPALAAAPTARPPLVAPPLPGEPGGPPRRRSGGGIRDLDLRLLDASGEELFADLGVSDVARIERFCPSETTHVRLVLEAYEGEGVAYWQLFRRGGSGSLP